MKSTIFICQLPQEVQDEIKKDVLAFFASEGIDPNEKDDCGFTNIENAMSDRLCNIEENIDISKYLK